MRVILLTLFLLWSPVAGATLCVSSSAPQAVNVDGVRVFSGTVQHNPYDLVRQGGFSHLIVADALSALALTPRGKTPPGTPITLVYRDTQLLMVQVAEQPPIYHFGGAFYTQNAESLKPQLLRRPIHGAVISSPFGDSNHPIFNERMEHLGVDYAAPTGTPIYAAGDGVITFKGRHKGYGKYLKIDHGGGLVTAYAHISKYPRGIKKGARVKQGSVVAYVGNTGNSTGPHLHFEIWKNGRAFDPLTTAIPPASRLCQQAGRDFAAFQAEIQHLVAKKR